MRQFLFSAVCIVLLGASARAQSLERQVFNTFGSVMLAGGYDLTANVGEPLTQTYLNLPQSRILTQGFLQPDPKDLTAGIAENAAGPVISVWPNPTAEGLSIAFSETGTETRSAAVYDVTGKCILQETLCTGCGSHYLSLRQLANGLYVLRISVAGRTVKEFKFIKVAN